MSKKKPFTGNTMTLKDFHGGSIPSDLPLPSAPGVVVRSVDRPGYDRSTSWGNTMGRPDHRSRPNSSHSTRHLDDKTPFLTHTALIGRNFDEDERKPLDGTSAPRRTVSDDSFRVPAARVEVKHESVSTGRVAGWQGSVPVRPLSSGMAGSSYAGKVNDVVHSPNMESNSVHGHAASGAHTNAWAVRKEATVGLTEPVQSTWSGQAAVSKFAHASALDKVSSGRWHSKLSLPYQADVEVIKHPESESWIPSKHLDDGYNRVDVVGGREYSESTLARNVERGLNIEEITVRGSRQNLQEYERTQGYSYSENKEKKPTHYTDGLQPTHSNGKFGRTELQPTVPLEVSDRPKLKLLPRSKPLANVEIPIDDPKKGQYASNSAPGHAETGNDFQGNVNSPKPRLSGNESANQVLDRPKLNLKPRSQPLEKLEGSFVGERKAVFGGARPREMVLKERGVDDVIKHPELGQPSERVKHDAPKTERVPDHVIIPSRSGERTENIPLDQRGTPRKFEKKDSRGNVETVDLQKKNWRNENWRNNNNNRETDRQQQQHQQQQQQREQRERQASPESWRKPVEHSEPASPDGSSNLRYGKAASAVELAQAFSKSFSDPKAEEQYSTQRRLPGRTQVPFSRLTRPTPTPTPKQINGY